MIAMNKIKRKNKKSKRIYRILYYIVIICYVASLSFFIYSIFHLKGIETILRLVLTIFFILYIFIYSFWNLLNLLRKKYKPLIITSIISLIFIAIFSFSSYYINVVYNSINDITEKDEVLYKSYLITLKDAKFSNKSSIGLINKDIEEYDNELAKKLYKKHKLQNDTVNYDDYVKMLNDLYDEKIDAAFMPDNYVTLFQNEEGFENILEDTKVIYEYSEKKKNEDLNLVSTKDFSEPLTFLLLGVDSETSGLNASAAFNGDTLMVITFNPQTLEAVMLSIPRDTYVPIACRNNAEAKINSAAAYGTECVVNTINNFLDLNIDYYVKINFKGVVELVDAVGGVDVDVEKPYFNSYNGTNYGGKMCEQNSDRQFGSHLVCVDPGWQTLNGEQALAYARNRHLYVGGDLDRVRHQQQVVEALANKVLKFKSIKDFQKILNAISKNIATNMSTDTILSGYQVIKNMIINAGSTESLLNINKAYLETYSLSVYVPSQGRNTSAQGYYEESLSDIKKAFKIALGKEKEEVIKTFSYSVNETYEAYSAGKNKKGGSKKTTLPSFIGKTVAEVKSFCASNNISLNIEYVDSGAHYNSRVTPGLVGDQSIHTGVLLKNVTSLTIYIPNAKELPEVKTETPNVNAETNNTTSEKTTTSESSKNSSSENKDENKDENKTEEDSNKDAENILNDKITH